MSHIPPVPAAAAGLLGRQVYRESRRQYGEVLDPLAVWRHHRGVFWTWCLFEQANRRALRVLPARVRDLAVYRTAVAIGCSWCVDFGASLWETHGLDPAVLAAVARGRYDELSADERAAVEMADAMTAQPPEASDERVADLRERFGDDGVVELTYVIALENMRSRFNAALGLSAQGSRRERPARSRRRQPAEHVWASTAQPAASCGGTHNRDLISVACAALRRHQEPKLRPEVRPAR